MNYTPFFNLKASLVIITFSMLVLSFAEKDTHSWLQFRGPGGSGIASENANPPIDFSMDKNMLWSVETPNGHSSPCIVQDNLIITGVVVDEKKYLVQNLDINSGVLKWQKEIIVDTLETLHPVNSHAVATPVSDGEFIYCYFPSMGLICYNMDGNEIWQSPIEFYAMAHGSGTSPILINDKVILNHDNMKKPRLLAFNKSNGDLVWEAELKKSGFFNSTSWSTPTVWENQIITHGKNKVEGFDLETGASLWQFEIGTNGCATPVVVDDVLYLNSWLMRGEESLLGDIVDFDSLFIETDQNHDGRISKDEFPEGLVFSARPDMDDIADEFKTNYMSWPLMQIFDEDKDDEISKTEWAKFSSVMKDFSGHGLVAIQLGGKGNITLSNRIWKYSENIPETPSVLVKSGLLWMVKNGGTVSCVDIQNGELIYKAKLGASGSYFSSPLYANGNIFFASYNGKITIIKEGRSFEIVNRVDLDEKILASPVALGNKLFVRTSDHLYTFQ